MYSKDFWKVVPTKMLLLLLMLFPCCRLVPKAALPREVTGSHVSLAVSTCTVGSQPMSLGTYVLCEWVGRSVGWVHVQDLKEPLFQ